LTDTALGCKLAAMRGKFGGSLIPAISVSYPILKLKKILKVQNTTYSVPPFGD